MQSRRIAVMVTWLGVTLVSIAIAWLAVARAVAGVSDPAPIVAAPAASSTPVTPPREQTSTTVTAGDPATTPSGVTEPSTVSPDSGPVTEIGSAEPESSTDDSLAPTAASSSSPTTKSFDSAGGVMTMSCNGGDASLVSATPNDGFTVAVLHTGPDDIDVEFRSGATRYTVHGWCTGGSPAAEIGDDDD